jgi:manganese/zinc/iron transport system permease protein
MPPAPASAPAADWLRDALLPTLLFERYNTSIVIIAATLLGLAAGIVGTFALLRKRAMMGDAIAHCTLPGIALAFLVATGVGASGRSLPVLLAGASIAGILGILAVQAIVRHTRIRDDAAIAVALSVFFGIGIVLLSYIQSMPTGTQGGLGHFIYGQTAAMQVHDARIIGGAAILAVVVALAFYKELRLVCFDDRFAAAIGLRVDLLDLLMMGLVVLVTVIGLQAVGLLLIVAMLIIPPAAARFWTHRFGRTTLAAAFIGAVSGYLGSAASALLPRLPTGAVIVLTAGAVFLFSMFFAPQRGVIAATLRHGRLRVRIATDHYLRAAFEALDAAHAASPKRPIPIAAIAAPRRWSPLTAAAITTALHARGLLRRSGDAITLTPRGQERAARITRNHRLWEQFLVTHADMAPSHVDRTADSVEHILSPDIVADLQAILEARGDLPRSIHPLDADHR